MNSIDPAKIDEWRGYVGKSERRTEVLEAENLRRFALAIGANPDVAASPPPLAHWAFFLPVTADSAIGQDGHPRRGGFMPDITLARRMFAGSKITFGAPLVLGRAADLVTTIADVSHKVGRSGDLVFVEVERVLSQGDAICVTERQSFVFRDDGSPATWPATWPKPAKEAPAGDQWVPNEINLFRFSATTFNSHRIHYDQHYATSEEGYPALVVHGPFTACKLAAVAMQNGPLASFSFRAMAPLFLGQTIYLQTTSPGDVAAIRCDNIPAMQAQATYR